MAEQAGVPECRRLPKKEHDLFKSIVRFYEIKQYKKVCRASMPGFLRVCETDPTPLPTTATAPTGRQGRRRGAEEVPQARGDAGDEGPGAQLPRAEGGGA